MMVHLINIQLSLTEMFASGAQVEGFMVSFSRCYNLLSIPQEAKQKKLIPVDHEGNQWISRGKIEFDHYFVRYRPETELVLSDINITINPNEKIGVVGRTGAGKSTLCISICRIIEKYSGGIKIDGIDISTVGLTDLRNRITVIPQEATLFKGTLRFNLDPENKNDDDEIMRLINKAGLTDLTVRDNSGLDFNIEVKGENLSSGEKQLICICRAILKVSFSSSLNIEK
jgi:ATP-binding cassette, subfamily C (CFTR/MRP), member 1